MPTTDAFAHGFRQVVLLLTWLVILPTVVLLALTLLVLFYSELQLQGILIVLLLTLVACLITGSFLVLLLVRREARLARLQTDFISKMSHELRTPLTAISMLVDTLIDNRTENAEQARECLEAVSRETAHLREQIERLLDWGRMEAGKKAYKRSAIPIKGIIEDALGAVSPIADSRQQVIELELPEQEIIVHGDHPTLVDALTNLLTNALKYSDRGQPIHVGAAILNDQAHLWVRDHGVGIPQREHRRIFRRFYRVDDRLSRETEGSGLGLAIVHHVVKGHQGHMAVESAAGQGSTFTMVLPLGTDGK